MGWLDNVESFAYRLRGDDQPPPVAKRQPTDDEVDGWFEAADNRRGPISNMEILAYLESRSSFRMWRLRHDLKWARKQVARLGVDPERLRNLL